MDFSNKTVLITGGVRGIGMGIAKKFFERDAYVIITGTGRSKLSDTFTQYNEVWDLDILSEKSMMEFSSKVANIRNLDILINNAGINIIEDIENLKYENWEKVLSVNLTGPMRIIKSALPSMKSCKNAKIINVSSIWGVIGKEKRNSYAASKFGLIGLTKTLALDLAKYNILVNAVAPGFTMTDLTRKSLSKSEMDKLCEEIPIKRFADISEIANLILFLASDLNTYITGQTIVIDGGFTIR